MCTLCGILSAAARDADLYARVEREHQRAQPFFGLVCGGVVNMLSASMLCGGALSYTDLRYRAACTSEELNDRLPSDPAGRGQWRQSTVVAVYGQKCAVAALCTMPMYAIRWNSFSIGCMSVQGFNTNKDNTRIEYKHIFKTNHKIRKHILRC